MQKHTKVSILGSEWKIIWKDYKEDDCFERNSYAGYCDGFTRRIVLCNMSTYKGWEHEDEDSIIACEKENLRHEIVHAFFDESGLQSDSFKVDYPWAKNEEMVDWIAIQGIKIYEAWKSVDAI